MKITYGDGSLILDGAGKGFEIIYKGVIRITNSPDNVFISANKNKIVGFTLDGSNLPSELFDYLGDLRLLSCKVVTPSLDYESPSISLIGVDYWGLDREKWEDDASSWGTSGKTYLVGEKQRYNRHSIAVNNNIKVDFDGQYVFEDGSSVMKGTLIHIHSDGVAMTGGVHAEDSVTIYPPKGKKPITKKQIKEITTTEAPAMKAPVIQTTYTGGGGSGGGGGGY